MSPKIVCTGGFFLLKATSLDFSTSLFGFQYLLLGKSFKMIEFFVDSCCFGKVQSWFRVWEQFEIIHLFITKFDSL